MWSQCEHQAAMLSVDAMRLIHSSPSVHEPNLHACSTEPLQVLPVVRVTAGNTTGEVSQVFLDQERESRQTLNQRTDRHYYADTCTHPGTRSHAHTLPQVHAHMHTHPQVHAHMHTHTPRYTLTCTHTPPGTRSHAHTHPQVQAHMHTHTQVYSRT